MSKALLAVLLAVVPGCLDEAPTQPDIAGLRIGVQWAGGQQRVIDAAIPNDIPCTGSESGFLGDSGIECVSAPWKLIVDGTEIETTPAKCISAHDALFGPVEKRCEGGRANAPLPDAAGEDVEIVVSNDIDEVRITLPGVRKTYAFAEVTPFESSSKPGIVRVDEVELIGGAYPATFTPPDGGAVIQASAKASTMDTGEIELSLGSQARVDGAYAVRVNASIRTEHGRIAVPIEGTLTVAR